MKYNNFINHYNMLLISALDLCARDKGGCHHTCKMKSNTEYPTFQCYCAPNFELELNQKTCKRK